MPFKVTNFGTNGKPVCDFLCENNSNLPPNLHCFRDMSDYWSNFHHRKGVPFFNALVEVNPYIWDGEICLKKLETSLYHMMQSNFDTWYIEPSGGMTHKCDRKTDKQTRSIIANSVLCYVVQPKMKHHLAMHVTSITTNIANVNIKRSVKLIWITAASCVQTVEHWHV